mmetsp:Transcript_14119/g.25567  ORF Transcript_14119/g.25567 Transcript_14119/m.25567 type:complete len:229 (-) Transcript_14119:629-1315(-)
MDPVVSVRKETQPFAQSFGIPQSRITFTNDSHNFKGNLLHPFVQFMIITIIIWLCGCGCGCFWIVLGQSHSQMFRQSPFLKQIPRDIIRQDRHHPRPIGLPCHPRQILPMIGRKIIHYNNSPRTSTTFSFSIRMDLIVIIILLCLVHSCRFVNVLIVHVVIHDKTILFFQHIIVALVFVVTIVRVVRGKFVGGNGRYIVLHDAHRLVLLFFVLLPTMTVIVSSTTSHL